MDARDKAVSLKQAYTERVKLRADSQREVNDLLQRKSAWTGPDVLRFTELVQQEHTNEQEENRAKLAMDAAEEAVEKGFSGASFSLSLFFCARSRLILAQSSCRRSSSGTTKSRCGATRCAPSRSPSLAPSSRT